MEKGPITYAEYWTSKYAEVNHFYSYGYNMGYSLYYRRASESGA